MEVFVAIDKETGKVVSGARGHSVFDSSETLRKSIGGDRWKQREAREKGCKVKDLYFVYKFKLNLMEGEIL
jgi:hypothetical protein